ncbi:MAG TPA: hypothetical protein VGK27_10575 [Candidatus Deferrimicrobiaceae bacterium]|jgi:hypothetical protein
MKKGTAITLALACLLSAGVATAAQKKDKTLIDLKAIQSDNVAPDRGHQTMDALGERVHGGEFGPWRCQIKILDRREQVAKMKSSGKSEGTPTSHFLSLSIMDPATGKSLSSGKGTVTMVGPDKKKVKTDLKQIGGPYSADIAMSKAGSYAFQIDFVSGKQTATVKFSYKVK